MKYLALSIILFCSINVKAQYNESFVYKPEKDIIITNAAASAAFTLFGLGMVIVGEDKEVKSLKTRGMIMIGVGAVFSIENIYLLHKFSQKREPMPLLEK